jgi:hypothetical protein
VELRVFPDFYDRSHSSRGRNISLLHAATRHAIGVCFFRPSCKLATLVADSLCGGREKRTICKAEIQIGNPCSRDVRFGKISDDDELGQRPRIGAIASMSRTLKLFCGLIVLAVMSHAAQSADGQQFRITTLSSRPDMISGGDVLVQIGAPQDLPTNRVTIKLNGRDATAEFHPDPTAHALIGLVTGLKPGENVLEVFDRQEQAIRATQLTLKNYPIAGPIFSGSQEHPFICQTQDFKLPDGSSLGPPIDANCSVKTVVTYVYKSTAAAGATAPSAGPSAKNFKSLPNPVSLPEDLAWTTTTMGEKVPYIIRVETGTINRAIYQIAMLHQPTARTPGPLAPPKAWNGRLVYSFGGGCVGGWFKQGTSIGMGGIISDAVVGKGYAEASASLNVFGNNCNDVLAAETMMMVKERFIKAYGKPIFTMSRGGSGGAEQQLPIAENYPGLLDGIIPSLTFPDVLANAQLLTDTQLLNNYFGGARNTLTEEQKLAVTGEGRLRDFTEEVSRINPAGHCPEQLPKSQRYDPSANRSGARCDVFDHNVNIYSRDPETGFARRPIDNVGVQYGLEALNSGKITTAQFLDLNEKIGGYDNDGNIVSHRSVADPLALRAAYQTGRVANGRAGLGQLPIIDVRPYRDLLPQGDVHLKFHSFSLRERLLKANGTFDNDVLLVGPQSLTDQMGEFAMAKLDEWLTNLGKDTSADPIMRKIVRAKPADLADSCYTESGDRMIEPQTAAGGKCNQLYPTYRSPRMVAGGPASNDVLKCQLSSVDFSKYKVTFNDAEKTRLRMIFANGVCDWSKPGIEQQPETGTWLVFK